MSTRRTAGKKPAKPSAAMVRIALKAPPAEVEFRGLFKVRLVLTTGGRLRSLSLLLA